MMTFFSMSMTPPNEPIRSNSQLLLNLKRSMTFILKIMMWCGMFLMPLVFVGMIECLFLPSGGISPCVICLRIKSIKDF
jgi:hypothetical protein